MEKTNSEMEIRLSTLRQMLKMNQMSLRTFAELDSIINYGLDGWNKFLSKSSERKQKKARNRR